MSVKEKLFKKLEEKESKMIEIRRHLHEYPELSFKEEKTAQFIEDFYKDKDVKVTTNVGNGYGIITEIKGNKEGKTIGLRADFDALPVTEEADVPFKSKNEGVMHACGHDAHTAYMLILAESLYELRDEWNGTIKIIHQHAEEVPPGGAKSIVESGILDDLDEVYGAHVFPMFDTGVIQFATGNAMAGCSNFDLVIQGSGGHGGLPHKTRDALVAASYFITNIQTIVSRNMNPLEMTAISITSLEDATGGYNVVQDKVTLRGTVRYLQEENKEFVYERFKDMVKGLEVAFDVECDLNYDFHFPVLYNHPEESEYVRELLKNSIGDYLTDVKITEPLTGSEDFAYYLQKAPGTYINVGAKPEGVEHAYQNHHPKFEINEQALLICAKSIGEITVNRLEA